VKACKMSGHAAPIPRGGFSACGTVITANRQQPILAGEVLFFENVGGNRQIAVRVKQLARLAVAVTLITQIDLCQPLAYRAMPAATPCRREGGYQSAVTDLRY